MPITFIVPGPIQQAARRGLEAHADPEWKLKGVAGASVADSLASGHVTIETVAKMHRFFAVNAKPYLHEVKQLRTLQDSPMIRSWHLHGAAAGRAWADRLFKESVEKGLVPADPVTELMSLRPDGVYNRFALGSWRFEYDLDPAKAARFVENYMRATGWSLDLRQAFGRSAEAVGNAIYRRFHTPDPFRQAFRALMAEDVEYRIAAQRDLEFMRRNIPPSDRLVLETFPKHVFTAMNPKQAAKLVWAPFVAYFILASEAPDILKPLNDTSVKPPSLTQKPKSWTLYHDTINTYIAYFQPFGARFVTPLGDEKFHSLPDDMSWVMWQAYIGKKLQPTKVQKLLGAARRWMAKNKLAGNLFHIFIADWKKANWQHILDNIPLDADVRPYFEKFMGTNPLPKEGVKLQQTLSKKSEKAAIFSYAKGQGWSEPEPVSVKKTGVYFASQKNKTPLGIYSVLSYKNNDFIYLGAWQSAGEPLRHFLRNVKTGEIIHSPDTPFRASLESGHMVVKQGHKDMPGTSYEKVTTAPEKVQQFDYEIDEEVAALLVDDFPDHYQEFMPKSLDETASSEAAFNRFGGSIVPGVTLVDKLGGEFVFLEAYQTPEGTILILRNPDGELIWQPDDSLAPTVETGNIKMKGLKSPEVLNKAGQQADPDMPGVPTEAEAPLTNMFNPGDILDLGTPSYYLVLGFDGGVYLALRLHATMLGSVLETFEQAHVESTGSVIGTHISAVTTGESYVAAQQHHAMTPIDLPPEFKTGSVILAGDDELTLVKAFQHPSLEKVALTFESKTAYWQGHNITHPDYKLVTLESIETPVESSYAPTELRPEPGAEDAMDEHDPETGKPHMCGTPAALAYIAKKGWQPATKPENTTLDFELGAKVAYGPSKTRTVIGYAFMPEKGTPVYITMTEKGNVSFKTTTAGNKAYGPVIEVLQEVVDTLVPKPGEAKPKFPKLNYALSNTAKKLAKEAGLIYIPAPDKAPFYVGTKLLYLPTSEKLRLLGWVSQMKGGEATGVPEAVMYDSAEEVMWPAVEIADLKKNYSIAYQHASAMDFQTGEVTFGKVPTDAALTVNTAGVSIGATPLPDGWDDPDPIEQPPMPQLPTGSHVSAGIVAIIPPGAMFSDGDQMQPVSNTLFLLTHPMNEFGGYTLTYPKGTVDKGESLEHTAVREVYEETGLSVKPVALLGDFKGRDSITRFFIGYVTGGSPTDAGKETDAVTFKPVPEEYQKQAWYAELKSRDKMVTDAAVKWILEKGWPNLFTGEKADTHSQVTGPQDIDGQTGVVAFNPNATYMSNPILGNQSSTVIDYKVPSHVVSWATASNSPFIGESAWAFVKALPFINEGYPPPGVQVLLKGGPPFTVQAYVRTTSPSGVVQSRILLEDKGDITSYTLYSQPAMGGSKEYFLKPADFKPVPSPVTIKKVTIPADTSKQDIWRALLFKAPFPINEGMIAALRAVAEEVAFDPAVFNCARQLEGTPQPAYGQVFTSQQIPLVCLGYVTVTDTGKKNHRYMFAQNVDGVYTILTADSSMMAMYLPSVSQEGFGNPDPWFTHPKPKTNKLIQQIYANGGNTKAVGATMSMFTKQWMKESGFPAWAVITKNVVQDVASLFVPGAATKPVYEAVIGGLKARMKATHKGKGKVSKKTKTPVGSKPTVTGVTQTAIASIPAWKPAMPPAKKLVKPKLPFNAAAILQQVDAPEPGLFKSTGHAVSGGSNPNMVLATPGGFQWFFKTPKDGSPVRVHAEVAASKLSRLLDKPTTVPVGALEFDGKLGSFQPLLEGSPPEADPNDLPDEDKAEVLAQHMLDMFMGDHDGFRGNWMRLKGGKLVPIDRGQAFKFVLKGLKESFDPNWHPKDNVGEGYAKKLLKDWGKSTAEIPEIAWKAAREMIEKISKLTKKQIQGILAPVLDAGNITAGKRLKIIDTLDKRRKDYLKNWTTVLKKLRKSFKWPKIGAVKLTIESPALTINPKEMGFGKVQDDEIATAVANPKKGRAMRVDRDAIEQQEVMVKSVLWEESPGKKIPAALVHFRVARPAGMVATKKMLKEAGGIKDVPDAGGPHRLSIDVQNDFWGKIELAVKTLNYHLAPPALGGMPDGPDGKPNQNTISACLAIQPDLQSILKATKKTAGTYGPMGEPNPIVNSMATMYLEYITDHIKPITDDLQGHLGKHSPKLGPFLWEEPKEEEEETEQVVKPPFTVQANSNAKWPKVVQTTEGLVVQHMNHDAYAGSQQNQFIIRDDHAKALIFVNPPGPVPGAPGLKTGVEGHKGISWGIIAGEPTAANIAHLFKLFQTASGIQMQPATKKDNEVLFWSRQAYVNQGKGHISPKSDGTGIVSPPYQAAMSLYTNGEDDEALKALQKITASNLGMTVAEAKKAAKPLIDGRFEEDGVGFMRHERLGWTREKLTKLFGKNWYVAHHLNAAMPSFIQALGDIPVLMAHNVRAFSGAPSTGASVHADYDSGGTQGIFMGFRKGSTGQSQMLYFDPALMLRTDLIVVNMGDGYGKVTHPRFTTPERWAKDTIKSHNSSTYSGHLGASSSYQVTARHGVNLLDYLHTAVCGTNTNERDSVIALCKERGWTKFGPLKRPPEKVFVLRGKEKL
jgi:8-oxo-dGTP pyrophosphatase MutT (NUDIX family)